MADTGFFTNEYPYTDFHEMNLSWVIAKIKELLDRIQNIETWKAEYQETYDNLKQLYDDLMDGKFPPSFVDAMTKWISEYGVEIIAQKIKAVHFGLTNDGYFCAFIPKSWSDVQFDTVTNSDDPLYGHLMLLYD